MGQQHNSYTPDLSSRPLPASAKLGTKNGDLVVRDHTFDYDLSGIEYLKAHQIPELFQDLTERLLTERPWDSLRFIRNILIHKVIQQQDHTHRQTTTSPKVGNDIKPSKSNTNTNSNSLSHPRFRRSKSKDCGNKIKISPNQSTKLSSTPHTNNTNNFNIDYDAEKLLESRTTKRNRSYSDSDIMFNNSFNNQLQSNTEFASENLDFINLNDLSKPIDIKSKQLQCCVTPRKQIQSKLNDKSASKSASKSPSIKIIDTISSVMDDMDINPKDKQNVLQHLRHQNDINDDIDTIIDNINGTSTSTSTSTSTNNGKTNSVKSSKSFGNIAKKFENKLKALSLTAKSIPQKLSSAMHAQKHDNDNDDNNNTSDLLHVNDDLLPSSIPSSRVLPPSIPIRRSRTLELVSPPPLRHILTKSQRPCFGFDIGGSLTKISFFEPHSSSRWNVNDFLKSKFVNSSTKYGISGVRDKSLSFPWKTGTFHFIHFQTHRMNEAVSLFKNQNLLSQNENFYATGGGAHKYSKLLTQKLSVHVKKGDELKCLISGLNFLLTHVSDECYYLSDPMSKKPSDKISFNIQNEGSVFPYLLVNVGSGVSILKVDSTKQFERIGGTQIGGGTYWGLCRLCNNYNTGNTSNDDGSGLTFAQAFELAIKGDAKKVNMLVSDIYGGDYPQCNLPGDLVASAFGKCVSMRRNDIRSKLNMGDIARGLLDMIAMNVAQLAYLNAMRFKITRIIFAGNFLRQNDFSMAMISYAIHYWSQGIMKACFLKHEGYFGSIGVMLQPNKELHDDDDDDVKIKITSIIKEDDDEEKTQNNNNNKDNNNVNSIDMT